jgi:hypothetical protein
MSSTSPAIFTCNVIFSHVSIYILTFVEQSLSRERGVRLIHISGKLQKAMSVLVSRGNSVSIVSGYGLDDRAIEDRSPAVAKVFFL